MKLIQKDDQAVEVKTTRNLIAVMITMTKDMKKRVISITPEITIIKAKEAMKSMLAEKRKRTKIFKKERSQLKASMNLWLL